MERSSKKKTILQVSRLSIQRDDTKILQNVSWQVQAGEHWAILGANGSGKTSLLSALTGYLTPTTGDIDVLGERYGQSDWRELRKKVGIVSSSVRQLMADSETALETIVSGKYAMIDFWGKPTPGDAAAAKRILRQIHCEYLADRPWMVLSQGERQRVLIGRALMAKPAVLILDEPCAGLDPVAREHFLHFINRLAQGGTPTLILVTHHIEEIQPRFSHVLLLKNGTVLAAAKKQSVLTSSQLTKAFDWPVRVNRLGRCFGLGVNGSSPAVV
jgi:iron complex transport system ATP-binding protein